MVVRPNQPAQATRDDLAKEVSFLPGFLLRGGAKSGHEIRKQAEGMLGEGAHPLEIFDETGKHVDQGKESGLIYGPGGDFQFELSDKDMKLTPQALSFLKDRFGRTGGTSPVMNLDRMMQHDSLYDYVPEMKDVQARIGQQESGDPRPEGGGYMPPSARAPMGGVDILGKHFADPNSNEPWAVRNILAHEINHPIQLKYGLPEGGNEQSVGLGEFYKDKMIPQAKQLRDAMWGQYKQFEAMAGGGPNAFAEWAKLHPEKHALLMEAQRVGGFPSFRSQAVTQPLGPFGQYWSLAGEQTAMRGANRSTMSAEELRANPSMESRTFRKTPEGKAGTPEPLQILKYGKDYALPDLPYWQDKVIAR